MRLKVRSVHWSGVEHVWSVVVRVSVRGNACGWLLCAQIVDFSDRKLILDSQDDRDGLKRGQSRVCAGLLT